jgi:hypothetical protein
LYFSLFQHHLLSSNLEEKDPLYHSTLCFSLGRNDLLLEETNFPLDNESVPDNSIIDDKESCTNSVDINSSPYRAMLQRGLTEQGDNPNDNLDSDLSQFQEDNSMYSLYCASGMDIEDEQAWKHNATLFFYGELMQFHK